MISGFCHGVNEICALYGFYAVKNVILLLTFPDLSVPPSQAKQSTINAGNT
jgi:hypothetical protein